MVELWWNSTVYFRWGIYFTNSQLVQFNIVGLLSGSFIWHMVTVSWKNGRDNCTMLTMPGQFYHTIGAIPSMCNTVLNSIMAEYSNKSWLCYINLFLQNWLQNANFWGGLIHSKYSIIIWQTIVNEASVGDVFTLHSCSAYNVIAMIIPFAVPHQVVIYASCQLACSCQYNHVYDEIVLVQNATQQSIMNLALKKHVFQGERINFFLFTIFFSSAYLLFVLNKKCIHSAKEWCYHYVRIPTYEKKIKKVAELRTTLSQRRWGPTKWVTGAT